MDELHEFHFDPQFKNPVNIESEESSYASSSASDEELSDDENHEEPQGFSSEVSSLASLIALNQTYLDLIERIERKVESLLENNREDQKRIKQILGNKKSNNHSMMPIYRAIFLPPYFKDTYTMIPSSNDDTREIRSRCRVNVLMKEEKSWSHEELLLLKKSVIAQLIDVKNREAVSRRDHIRGKILNYKAEDRIDQLSKWKDELVTVNRRLNYLSSQDEESALKSASYDEIDWAKISARDFKGSRSILQLKMKWLFEQAPEWNKDPWTAHEDEELKISGKTPWQNWDLVALKLDTKRTAFMCFERFHFLYKKFSAKRPWTTREDEKLLSLIDRFTFEDSINWKRVAAHMPERTRLQCEIRYNRSLDPNLIHGRWTDAEDMLLIASVNKYGPQDWPRISSLVPGRTDVQCRARWVDNLDYKKSKAPWSKDEDEAVLVGMQIFGRSDYSSIAKMIPGRNTNSVKTRIRTLFRWKIMATRNTQNSTVPCSLGQVMENSRAKTELKLERFNKVMEMSKNIEANQHGFALARRLGYGNYILENGQQNADYSLIKQKLTDNFGKWFISKNGHWVRLKKNPNEFGKEELEELIDGLSDEKRQMFTNFMNERAKRQIKVDVNVPVNEIIDVEQSDRIASLMDTVLELTQKDIDNYRKSHLSTGFNFLKLPSKNSSSTKVDKRTAQGRRLTASFSTLIHDLAPRRYSLVDRVTEEITYRINQLPVEERRGYILNLMCDMIFSQMDLEVQSGLNTLPKPVLNLKVLNYLHKNLLKNISEQDELNVIDVVNDSQDLPSSDDSNSMPFASRSDSELYQTLKHLTSPSVATCNFLLHYKNIIRPILLSRAVKLFPIMDMNFRPVDSTEKDDTFIDIRLSENVVSDPSYQLLKQRMMRVFLLPMLLKRAFESDDVRKIRISARESQSKLKELQRSRLIGNVAEVSDENNMSPSTSNNSSSNENWPFRVFNPQLKNSLPAENKSKTEVPIKRQRIPKITVPQSTEPSIGEALSSELKTEFENDEFPLTNTGQILQTAQMYLTPNLYLPYRPRKTCFTPAPNPSTEQELSVRDFILMNQMLPPEIQGTRRRPYKRRR